MSTINKTETQAPSFNANFLGKPNYSKKEFQQNTLSIKANYKAELYNISKTTKNGEKSIRAEQQSYHFELSYQGKQKIIEDKTKKSISTNLNISIDVQFNQTSKTSKTDKTSNSKFEAPEDFYSPKKTAKEIMDFARSLFPLWLQQNSDTTNGENETSENKISNFISEVKGGIKKGMQEAISDLKNMNKYDDTSKKSINNIQTELDKLFKKFDGVLKKDYLYLTQQKQQTNSTQQVA